MSTIPFIKVILLLTFMIGCCFTGLVKEDQSRAEELIKAGYPLKRVKRTMRQFGMMIKCETGRKSLEYNGYGCWCRIGGRGPPVDSTDRCCKIHDDCYGSAIRKGCNPYTDVYNRFQCSRCASSNDECEKFICECDGAAARCFTRAHFNPNYKNYPHDRC